MARRLRRGAARAIRNAGGSFAQLLTAGQWRSAACHLYVDPEAAKSTAMARSFFGVFREEGTGGQVPGRTWSSQDLDIWGSESPRLRPGWFKLWLRTRVANGYVRYVSPDACSGQWPDWRVFRHGIFRALIRLRENPENFPKFRIST